MAFDPTTRNRLRTTVADIRRLLAGDLRERADAPLSGDFADQLRARFGVRDDGTVLPADDLVHLSPDDRATARRLHEALEHFAAQHPDGADASGARPAAFERLVRELAFTTLNRFVALRLAEARDLIAETVAAGMRSRGFQVFASLVGGALGSTYDTYRAYLDAVGDELALDLGGLFERAAPTALLFPSETAMERLLALLNAPELEHVWAQDETIGWVYQFFNTREEITRMRDEGRSGPRNTREMAVRNQFFTPRYVVELLVDNTLGRYWIEAMRGRSRLVDALPAYAHGAEALETRPLRDPREIRLLDPACGSMHFGLYAFDVFEQIYHEAWTDVPELFKDLREAGVDDDAFARLVPKLILENNLHGVDIDPRAAQIAGLALWLRAQRAWKALGVPPADRPRIERSGVVTAEPMPGERDLLEAFVASLKGSEGRLLGELVERVWERIQLAGEAGSLLKVEREIADAVASAQAEWKQQAGQLSLGMAAPTTAFSVEGVAGSFFRRAEERVLKALRTFAEAGDGEGEGAYRRRLFSGDAAQGFAFVEAMQRTYAVVVMNPPFGDPSVPSKAYLEATYLDTKGDVYKAFVERARDLLESGGYLGCLSSRTGFFLSSAEAWRTRVVLGEYRPLLLADLGMGVLDAMVETAAYVLRALTDDEDALRTRALLSDLVTVDVTRRDTFSAAKYAKVRGLKKHQGEAELSRLASAGFVWAIDGTYTLRRDAIRKALGKEVPLPPVDLLCLRLLGECDKDTALQNVLTDEADVRRFRVDPASFGDVPGSPFAYWVSDTVRGLFRKLPPFESEDRVAKQGLATADDFRFVRCWWEVPSVGIASPDAHPTEWYGPYCVRKAKWFPLAKGGAYSPYYADVHLVVEWSRDGIQMRQNVIYRYPYLNGNSDFVVKNSDYYFRPGISWPGRPYKRGAFSRVPVGTVFSHTGMMAFAPEEDLWPLGAILNSDAYIGLLHLLMPRGGAEAHQTLKYELGYIVSVPIPPLKHSAARLAELANVGFQVAREADQMETSHVFTAHPAMRASETTLIKRLAVVNEAQHERARQLATIQSEINDIAFERYGVPEPDRVRLQGSLYGHSVETEIEPVVGVALSRGVGLEPELAVASEGLVDIEPTTRSSIAASAEDDSEDEADEATPKDPSTHAHALLSYALGCAIGRWDVRFGTGERPAPPLPDPFAPLPRVSPGTLVAPGTDLPATEPPEGYPLAFAGRFPSDGLLVQDGTRPGTLIPRVREVLAVLFPGRADAIEAEALALLGVPSLDAYFSRPNAFFERHLKQYSRSRRKAPIYLPLRPERGEGVTLWLYVPRLSDATLYAALTEHVEPRLRDAEADLARLADASERQRTAAADRVVALRDLQAELRRIVALPYRPDLNDGTVIAAAPLAALVPHRPFRRELETRWRDLERGKYDWAHLAMALWPDRVRQKCETDKSLAIAHGLA